MKSLHRITTWTLINLMFRAGTDTYTSAFAWTPNKNVLSKSKSITSALYSSKSDVMESPPSTSQHSRRLFLDRAIGSFGIVSLSSFPQAEVAMADEKSSSLKGSLYTILRVREATSQETRLISTGKFKDVQRANVKLAVKFLINNYRLSDTFITAGSYLEGNRRIEAGNIGQAAVESLYIILEYFDSSDIQNIKVDNMAGKETLVLKGLETTRSRIDEFVDLFPADIVDSVRTQIQEENELNAKEFDPDLGAILNPSPSKS